MKEIREKVRKEAVIEHKSQLLRLPLPLVLKPKLESIASLYRHPFHFFFTHSASSFFTHSASNSAGLGSWSGNMNFYSCRIWFLSDRALTGWDAFPLIDNIVWGNIEK